MSTTTTSARHVIFESPIGPLTLVGDDEGLWCSRHLAAVVSGIGSSQRTGRRSPRWRRQANRTLQPSRQGVLSK